MEAQSRPSVSDSKLQQKLEESEKAKRDAEIRSDMAESRHRDLASQLQSAKVEADKCIEEKDNLIQDLHL